MLLPGVEVIMAEILTLTTPIAQPSRTTYRVQRLTLDWDAAAIRIDLLGSDGVVVNASYDGAVALALMTTLNSANMSTTSLHKRILQKLQTDGILPAGTVSGTPS